MSEGEGVSNAELLISRDLIINYIYCTWREGGDLVKCLGTGTEYIQFGVCTGNVQDALNLISMQVPDFQKGYGDFLNKLMTFHYIPLSAIGKRLQNIFNHFYLNKLFI
jgi:hypothetical protein